MWDPSSNLGLEILISQFAKKKFLLHPLAWAPRLEEKSKSGASLKRSPMAHESGLSSFPLSHWFPWPWGGVSCDNEHHPMVCSEETWHLGFLKSSQLSVEQRSFGNHEITHTIPLWTWRNQLHEVTLLDLAEAHWCSRFWAISIWFRSLPSPSPCQGTQKNRGKVFGISVACRRLVNTLKILGHYRWRIRLKKAHKMRQKEGEVVCMVSGVMQGGMCNSEDHSEGSPEISR